MENRDHEIACLAKENGDMKELHLESSAEEQLVTPAGTMLNQGADGYLGKELHPKSWIFTRENPWKPIVFWGSQIEDTLWLCQNSYWKWPLIVDFPIEHGDFQ